MAHRSGEYAPFDVTAFADEIIRRIAMRDPFDILVDDESFIQVGSHGGERGAGYLRGSRRGPGTKLRDSDTAMGRHGRHAHCA